MAVRYLCIQALTARASSVSAHHLRRDRRLVEEREPLRIERRLFGYQLGTRSGDVRTILLGGVQRFF
jgi:hypothetical protein